MFDITALATLIVPLIGLVSLVAVLRVASGADGDLAAMFGRPWELAWPRGVQEEEPQPWRLDRLDAIRPSPAAVHRPLSVAPPAPEAAASGARDVAA